MQAGTLPAHEMELLADNLIAAGAGAVITMRWPVNIQCSREFATLFYQELADGMSLGEAMKRTRSLMAQRHTEDYCLDVLCSLWRSNSYAGFKLSRKS